MNHLSIVLTSFLTTIFAIFVLCPLAKKLGLMDKPGGRKQHACDTPLVGGIGIYIGAVILAIAFPPIFDVFSTVFFIAALVLVVGIVDDLYGVSVGIRTGAFSLAGLLMVNFAGAELVSFGDFLGTGAVQVGALSVLITILAVNCAINAVNMTDGLDGLAAGLVLISLVFIGTILYQSGLEYPFRLVLYIGCSIVAFLVLNFRFPWTKRASVFLGDSGSAFLGLIIAWLLIKFSQGDDAVFPPVLSLFLMGFPLMDIVGVILRRVSKRSSPFAPDRNHFHHIMIRAGFGVRKTVITIYLYAIGMGLFGYSLFQADVSESVMFAAFLFCFSFYTLHIHYLKIRIRKRQSRRLDMARMAG